MLVGTPAEEIARFARQHGADLIVMGTHGYGPVRRFLLGSVADRVVREASCPVLLFPHRDLRGPKVRREIDAFAINSRWGARSRVRAAARRRGRPSAPCGFGRSRPTRSRPIKEHP